MNTENIDYQVVAAIIAAITEYEGNSNFEIKSITKANENRWQKAGRDSILRGNEQIYLRRRRPL